MQVFLFCINDKTDSSLNLMFVDKTRRFYKHITQLSKELNPWQCQKNIIDRINLTQTSLFTNGKSLSIDTNTVTFKTLSK